MFFTIYDVVILLNNVIKRFTKSQTQYASLRYIFAVTCLPQNYEPPVLWAPGAVCPRVKQQVLPADFSLPSSATIMNSEAIPSLTHMSSRRGA
jgi:hypothetical protein